MAQQITYLGTLAGNGTAGYVDGNLKDARFSSPEGIKVDANGNIYVADRGNHAIRKITPSGIVSTLAGNGVAGYADGTGTAAQFNDPIAIDFDLEGNLIIAEQSNHRIRKVTTNGVVTTIAGSGIEGFSNGPALEASFNDPVGVAVDSDGNIFVADRGNSRIRKIGTDGMVSTFAGSATGGSMNGTGAAASFNGLFSLSIDENNNLYVSETHRVRKITPEAVVSTIAGIIIPGTALGNASSARFSNPIGAVLDNSGELYVANAGMNTIRKVTLSPSVNVTAFVGGTAGFVNGSLSAARLRQPTGITIDANGNFYFAERGNHAIRKIQYCDLPTPEITVNGSTTICSDGYVELSGPAGMKYLWNNGDTSRTIQARTAGVYTLRLTGGACTSNTSLGVTVATVNCNNVFTGVGNFSNTSLWSDQSLPSAIGNPIIDGTVTVNSDVTINNLTINLNRNVVIPSGVTLTVTGNISNQGTISGDGTLRLAGTSKQSFGGGTISNLFADNADTVIQNAATQISSSVSLGENQVLDLNNLSLVLLSTASGTARIAPVPTSASIINSS
ncbi:MAG: NHL repeat-containing protein, partial [Flexibacteraceae bacterium]